MGSAAAAWKSQLSQFAPRVVLIVLTKDYPAQTGGSTLEMRRQHRKMAVMVTICLKAIR